MAFSAFQYHEPDTIEDACDMLDSFGSDCQLLAGGTDLIVQMRNRQLKPGHLISLTGLEGMNRIQMSDDTITLGSGCTIADVAASDVIRYHAPALAVAAMKLGSPTIRNMGTIGGNILTASPAADLPPALIAYNAMIRSLSRKGERWTALDDFFHSPGKTHLLPGEILTHIRITIPSSPQGGSFFKLGNRNALQISIINGACALILDADDGHIIDAKVVLGAVAPTVIRSPTAERLLTGQIPDDKLFRAAGMAAAQDCNPIDDLRASAAYRKEMVLMLTKRALRSAWKDCFHPHKEER